MTQSDPAKTETPTEDKAAAFAGISTPTSPTPAPAIPAAVDSVKAEEVAAEKVAEAADAAPEGAAPDMVEPEDTSAEDASDAQLRAWARDNGIEDVPGSGKLSAVWREQITAAMAADLAMDPKDEGSVEPASSKSSPTTETTSTTGDSTDQKNLGSTEEESPEPAPEYRSVWQAPETWVSSQAFTA
jgi:hypothetical protein